MNRRFVPSLIVTVVVVAVVAACSSGGSGGGSSGGTYCTSNSQCASGVCIGATSSSSGSSSGSGGMESDIQPLGTCQASSSSSSGSGGAGCDGKPAGAYRCSGSTGIEVCRNGDWASAGSCGCAVKVGDPRKPPYAATCKIIIGTANAVECNYAGVDCKQCLPGEACKTSCTKCATATSSSCCP